MGFMEQKTKEHGASTRSSECARWKLLPTTKVEAELFELQKHFIYAVFLCKVTAAEAVNIVKEEQDAQICYQVLVHRFEQSPEATMDAQTIREKIH